MSIQVSKHNQPVTQEWQDRANSAINFARFKLTTSKFAAEKLIEYFSSLSCLLELLAQFFFTYGVLILRGSTTTQRVNYTFYSHLILFLQDWTMLTLGLGQLFYVLLCFINAIAVLSEERFLARSMRDENKMMKTR